MANPKIKPAPGRPCRICENTTFLNPAMCVGCAVMISGVTKLNADRVLEQCLRVLEIPVDSEAARLVMDRAGQMAGPHRLNSPGRYGKAND